MNRIHRHRPSPGQYLVLQGSGRTETPTVVRCPWAKHTVNQPYTFLPSPSPTSWVTHTPTHTCTPTCTHEDRLELKLQDSPERNLRDWTSVEAEIQIVNQSDSVSLRSPHHHLIRRPPMSLRFPVRLAAPCKECHEHCTDFVDHIRYDHVLPAPSALNFFVNHHHLFKKEALFF